MKTTIYTIEVRRLGRAFVATTQIGQVSHFASADTPEDAKNMLRKRIDEEHGGSYVPDIA